MPSPKKSRSRNRLDEFVLPEEDGGRFVNVPAIGASTSVTSSLDGKSPVESATKASWGRAIDRYVASVLEEHREGSQPDELKIFSLAQNVEKATSFTGVPSLADDASFAPMNPFDESGDPGFTKKKMSTRMRENWKPLAMLCFGVAIVIFVSAGVASTKGGRPDDGSKVVGTPEEPVVIPDPTMFPTANPTGSPTYYPTTSWPTSNPVSTPTTLDPSSSPTPEPTGTPSSRPSLRPTSIPTGAPINAPSESPSDGPTSTPTSSPTSKPTMSEKYYEMMKAAMYISGEAPFNATSTAQSLAFHWLYYEGNPSSNLYEFFEQYAAAVVFFSLTRQRMSSISYTSMLAQDVFTSRREVCGWSGIRCAYNYTSEMTHITEIKLAGKKLTGTIPNEIRFLPYLTKIDLADNEIAGTIPEDVYSLKRLRHLYLNNNKLQGTISEKLDDLHLAEHIYLGQNSLTGTLPSNFGQNRPNNWRMFSLYSNKLSGLFPEGMRLRNAYMLDFSRNQFSGSLPSDFEEKNYSKLRLLYFDHNLFSGTIPPFLNQLRKLNGLFLNDNLLEGGIPKEISEDEKVNLLTLRVQNNNLTTAVPASICELDVTTGEGELVELGVDCDICNGCSLCKGRCH